MMLTLNEAAFIRLLAYTGLDGEQLVRAVPSLAPRRGPTAAMRAYEIASGYLQHSWRTDQHPSW